METEPKRLAIPVWPDAGRLVGLSRATMFARVADHTIPSVRIGRRILIPVAKLEALLNGEQPKS